MAYNFCIENQSSCRSPLFRGKTIDTNSVVNRQKNHEQDHLKHLTFIQDQFPNSGQ